MGDGMDTADDKSSHKSCGFPDIDSSNIDLNKVHYGPAGYAPSLHTEVTEQTMETAGYHTFPNTSTTMSPFPLNKNLKNGDINKALQSLQITMPKRNESAAAGVTFQTTS